MSSLLEDQLKAKGVEGRSPLSLHQSTCLHFVVWISLYSHFFFFFPSTDVKSTWIKTRTLPEVRLTCPWKCRQVVKRSNSSLSQKLMTFFEVYHEAIKSENNRRWGLRSKWHGIAFPPLEFEVQFSTETISVTAIQDPWLSLSLSLQVSSLLDDASAIWNAALVSHAITVIVGLDDVI